MLDGERGKPVRGHYGVCVFFSRSVELPPFLFDAANGLSFSTDAPGYRVGETVGRVLSVLTSYQLDN